MSRSAGHGGRRCSHRRGHFPTRTSGCRKSRVWRCCAGRHSGGGASASAPAGPDSRQPNRVESIYKLTAPDDSVTSKRRSELPTGNKPGAIAVTRSRFWDLSLRSTGV
jgi:hypothetical protein